MGWLVLFALTCFASTCMAFYKEVGFYTPYNDSISLLIPAKLVITAPDKPKTQQFFSLAARKYYYNTRVISETALTPADMHGLTHLTCYAVEKLEKLKAQQPTVYHLPLVVGSEANRLLENKTNTCLAMQSMTDNAPTLKRYLPETGVIDSLKELQTLIKQYSAANKGLVIKRDCGSRGNVLVLSPSAMTGIQTDEALLNALYGKFKDLNTTTLLNTAFHDKQFIWQEYIHADIEGSLDYLLDEKTGQFKLAAASIQYTDPIGWRGNYVNGEYEQTLSTLLSDADKPALRETIMALFDQCALKAGLAKNIFIEQGPVYIGVDLLLEKEEGGYRPVIGEINPRTTGTSHLVMHLNDNPLTAKDKGAAMLSTDFFAVPQNLSQEVLLSQLDQAFGDYFARIFNKNPNHPRSVPEWIPMKFTVKGDMKYLKCYIAIKPIEREAFAYYQQVIDGLSQHLAQVFSTPAK